MLMVEHVRGVVLSISETSVLRFTENGFKRSKYHDRGSYVGEFFFWMSKVTAELAAAYLFF